MRARGHIGSSHPRAGLIYAPAMTTSRLILLPAIACALASCTPLGASKKDDGYDTSNPYGNSSESATAPANPSAAAPVDSAVNTETANYQPVNPVNPPANPTYSPAAYEDNSGAKPAAAGKGKKPVPAPEPKPTTHAAAAAPVPAGATVHTVVAGDSLSKISRKYHVPVASIKAANHMTNDTVVIGKKLQIPAH